MDAKLFNSDPRDFAIEMVANGLVSADHLLMCALKYMSHDDVRDMLDCNELSPRFDDEEETCIDCGGTNIEEGTCTDCETKEWLDGWDDGEHDIDAMRSDIANNNLEVGDDERAEEYEHENIVRTSLTNGQFTQAKEQCERYGLDYADFHEDTDADDGEGPIVGLMNHP